MHQEKLKDSTKRNEKLVIDPTTGKLTPIQECVNNIVGYASYNALTVDEWNKLGLTVDEANHLMVNSLPIGFTCYQWMHDAKKLLIPQISVDKAEMFVDYKRIVREYISGAKVWLNRNVDINWLMWATTGTYSCGDLTDMQFTFDELVDANLTMNDWNFKGNVMLVHATP